MVGLWGGGEGSVRGIFRKTQIGSWRATQTFHTFLESAEDGGQNGVSKCCLTSGDQKLFRLQVGGPPVQPLSEHMREGAFFILGVDLLHMVSHKPETI